VNGLSPQDVWVMSALEPIRKTHKLLPTSDLYFLDAQNKFSQSPSWCARLAGYDADTAAYATVTPADAPKADAPTCFNCNSKFNFLTRRHHCKNCGHSLCDKPACSTKVYFSFVVSYEVVLFNHNKRSCFRLALKKCDYAAIAN
jgi:FYVE zinc finger